MGPETELHRPHTTVSLEDASTVDLVQRALLDARELVSAEIALAKQEARTEANAVLTAIVATALWIVHAIFAAMALVATLVLAFGGTPLVAFAVMTGSSAVLAVAGYFIARRSMPAKLFEKTQDRVEEDVRELKDRWPSRPAT